MLVSYNVTYMVMSLIMVKCCSFLQMCMPFLQLPGGTASQLFHKHSSAHAPAPSAAATEPPRSAKAYKLADTLVRKLLLESEAHSVTFMATPRRQVGIYGM